MSNHYFGEANQIKICVLRVSGEIKNTNVFKEKLLILGSRLDMLNMICILIVALVTVTYT